MVSMVMRGLLLPVIRTTPSASLRGVAHQPDALSRSSRRGTSDQRHVRAFASRAAAWSIREDAVMERPDPPSHSDMDRALLHVVTEAYEDLPAGAATLTN